MSLSDKKRYGELSSACNERKYYYPEEAVKEAVKELEAWIKLEETKARESTMTEDLKGFINPFLKKMVEVFGEGLI